MNGRGIKRATAVMVVALGAALTGCAAHEDTLSRNIAANHSLGGPPPLTGTHTFGGVSIDFDAIGDWRPLPEASKEVFAVYQKPDVPLYTRALVVMSLHPPRNDFANDQAFIAAAKRSFAMDHTREDRRIALDTAPGTGRWKRCLKYYKKFTTGDFRSAPNKRFIEEAAGYICRHPTRTGEVLGIYYSERYLATTSVTGFNARASKVLKGVAFTSD